MRDIVVAATAAESTVTAGSETGIATGSVERGEAVTGAAVLSVNDLDVAANQHLDLTMRIQHSDDNSTWTDLEASAKFRARSGAVTGAAGGVVYSVELTLAKRYIRASVTPDFTASSTDNMKATLSLFLGGFADVPEGKPSIRL